MQKPVVGVCRNHCSPPGQFPTHETLDVALATEPVGQVSGAEVPPRQTLLAGQTPHAVPFQAVAGRQMRHASVELAPRRVVLARPGQGAQAARAPPREKSPHSHSTQEPLTMPSPGAHEVSQSEDEVAPGARVERPAAHACGCTATLPPAQKLPTGHTSQKDETLSRYSPGGHEDAITPQ
jgi:hypothetical protein